MAELDRTPEGRMRISKMTSRTEKYLEQHLQKHDTHEGGAAAAQGRSTAATDAAAAAPPPPASEFLPFRPEPMEPMDDNVNDDVSGHGRASASTDCLPP